jgi:hypothetical protein
MTEPYAELGGQPPTDDQVTEFVSRLSATARRNYQGGQVAHAHLVKALSLGWTAKQLAAECSKDLPTSRAYAVIQSRLAWCAEHPPPTAPAGKAVPWCGKCSAATYRWIVDAEDRPLRPCPDCSPQRNQMARHA